MIATEIKELIKRLLKNKLITVQEVAMLQANKKEDRGKLIELVQRLYDNGRIDGDYATIILIEEEDVLMLLEYIDSEPVKIAPVAVIPEFPGVKTAPVPYTQNPYVAPNVPYTDPQNPPHGHDNVIYCAKQNKMYTAYNEF